MHRTVDDLVAAARREHRPFPGRFLDDLAAGTVPPARLRMLAGELYHLVSSDRRSFALLATRFPDPLFAGLAAAGREALRLLLDFGAALGVAEPDLAAYEPTPLAHAYPAYLARTAAFGPRSAVPLALLAAVADSGGVYTRVADALQERYGHDDRAVAHFRFYADTPAEVLDEAAAVAAAGLAAGDDPAEAVRAARLVHAYEGLFWSALAG